MKLSPELYSPNKRSQKINILNESITPNLCIDLLKEEHNFKDIKTSAIGFI